MTEPRSLENARQRLDALLDAGLRALESLAHGRPTGRPIEYATWHDRMASRLLVQSNSWSDADWRALWALLVTDPDVAALSGRLPPGDLGDVEILPEGARLTIDLGKKHKTSPPVVTLRAPLFFKSGKHGRLECQSVSGVVSYTVRDLGSQEDEARRVGADARNVTISRDERLVTVEVESLNHAYTVASRRLRPERRSHTGRVFDHLWWESTDLGRLTLLEDIRQAAEAGSWRPMDAGPDRASEANQNGSNE